MASSDGWLKLTLDDETNTHELVQGRNRSLNIFSHRDKTLYLGGTDQDLPWYSWNKESREPFRGCVWGVRFNSGETVDLVKALGKVVGATKPQCMPSVEFCTRRPCENGGVCSEIQKGYRCDCSDTAYTGRNCEIGESTMCSIILIRVNIVTVPIGNKIILIISIKTGFECK